MSKTSETIKAPEDLTGQTSFTRNVLFSWGSYLVYIVAGFVLPRMISTSLGQSALGVWDFAWMTVGYFGLIELGVGSSVDRYVAQHRALGDVPALTRSISTLWVLMSGLGFIILIMSIVVSWLVVPMFAAKLGPLVGATCYTVFFLGLGIAAEVACSVFFGVIVGVHRWDLHNSVSAGVYTFSVVAMMIALSLGGGLISLAVIHTAGTISGVVIRIFIAYRVCPELRLHWREARLSVVREQVGFSAKNLIPRIGELLGNQSTSLMLAACLGPASLAVFSRPRALLKHTRMLVAKFSFILIPSASSLQARDQQADLRRMFTRRTHQVGCLVVPAVLWMSVLGGPFIGLWMGKDYLYPWLVPMLAFGTLATLLQDPVWAIMSGLNRHGRIGLAKLFGSMISAGLVASALWIFKLKLVGVALGLVIPITVVDGVVVPIMACRALGLPVCDFYKCALLRPLLWSMPSVLCLLCVRLLLPNRPLLMLAVGVIVGGLALLWTYYQRVLPDKIRFALLKGLKWCVAGS